ncbi:MAG: MOSC domain-containing protein [Elainellaceae cyanobacterium]
MVTLSGLYIYPIKSAAGISLSSATVQAKGFQHDRRWMLVDSAGKFMSQRTCPKLALVTTAIDDAEGELVIAVPDHGGQRLPLQPPSSAPSSPTTAVEVWGDRCEAVPMPAAVSDWFSAVLGKPCRLVYMPDSCDRPADRGRSRLEGPMPQVSFADAYPFLLISEASLTELNQRLGQRLEQPVPMNRFRPNLVVQGCSAFAEDSWTRIRVGSVDFRVAKPCSRCTITTVDQVTGQRSPEPLRTLGTFRRWRGKIWFGQNLVQETAGTVQVGDAVEVLA